MEKVIDILSGRNERRELEYEKWKTWMERYKKEELQTETPPAAAPKPLISIK
jgi:hypothetical protein